MNRIPAVNRYIILWVTIFVTGLLVPKARAQVRALTLGIDTNCPYGLAE